MSDPIIKFAGIFCEECKSHICRPKGKSMVTDEEVMSGKILCALSLLAINSVGEKNELS